MVEPGFEDGRRLAGVLGRSEDDNGVGGRGFVTAGLPADTPVEPPFERDKGREASQQNPIDPGRTVQPRNSFNSSSVTGPGRRIRT
jgi:hypothetical protein